MYSINGSCRRAFTRIELAVVIALSGIVTAMLLAAIQKAREAENQKSCLNSLRQLAVMCNEHDTNTGYLPGAPPQLLVNNSVLVLLAPSWEQQPIGSLNISFPGLKCPTDSTMIPGVYGCSYTVNINYYSNGNCLATILQIANAGGTANLIFAGENIFGTSKLNNFLGTETNCNQSPDFTSAIIGTPTDPSLTAFTTKHPNAVNLVLFDCHAVSCTDVTVITSGCDPKVGNQAGSW
jgi:type II secretory pathway pseudopilin PulG